MASVPPGGPATINGILYQMLWSLLRATKLQSRDYTLDGLGQPIAAFLILEPVGGGGDLQGVEGTKGVVEQLKAKSSLGTWALADVIGDVLPDLYLATEEGYPDTVFRFLTEGRMGGWHRAYEFFQWAASRCQPWAASRCQPLFLGFRLTARAASRCQPLFLGFRLTARVLTVNLRLLRGVSHCFWVFA